MTGRDAIYRARLASAAVRRISVLAELAQYDLTQITPAMIAQAAIDGDALRRM